MLQAKRTTNVLNGSLVTQTSVAQDEPSLLCENPACQKRCLVSDMINYTATIGSPGNKTLSGFQCFETTHQACSLECFLLVAHACVNEHLYEYLLDLHSATPESVHYKTACSTRGIDPPRPEVPSSEPFFPGPTSTTEE